MSTPEPAFSVATPPVPEPPPRWDVARVKAAVAKRTTAAHWRKQWRLRVVKTRFGIETVRNLAIDLRYGGPCGGTIRSAYGYLGAYGTSSADYDKLRRLFTAENGLAIGPNDVLVDVGSGKGRVLNFWLDLGLGNRIVGIELDPRFAESARRRLARYPNVEVICGDAIEHLPADATVLYLFNPFGPEVLARFRDRVAATFPPGHPLRIVYYFTLHLSVFQEDPRFVVEPLRTDVFHPAAVIRLAATP
jgi:SAM-dependent methyltransferase